MADKPKLTRAERKQIEAVIRKYRGDGKPHTAQDTIPYQIMYPDGICYLGNRRYSQSIEFFDINYLLAQPDDQTAIFEYLCDLYNYLDSSIHVQFTYPNRKSDREQLARSFEMPPCNDGLDPIRQEQTDILKRQLARGNNGSVKTKYITYTIEADNLKAARARLSRISLDIQGYFKIMGAVSHVLDGKERLEVLHGILHPDGESFHFDWKWLAAGGLSTKDHMGAEYSQMVLTVVTMFIGLFVIILLAKKGVKAAVLVGMLVASVIYWAGCFIFLGTNPFASLEGASFLPPFHDMVETTLFKFDFTDFFNIGWFTAISLIITFCMIDMFDTIGTLVGTASRAGMTDKDGNMPNMKEALLSDAVGTVAGACCGTSTVTTFVESASGVEAGGRTGLTSLTAAFMFLACMFIAPVAAVIPAAATSSALIYVGILMLQGLKNVDFNDLDQVVPVFLMLLAMPISGSIGHGIGIAMISYTVIKVFSGRAKEVSILTYVISLLFIIKFFAVV